MKTIRPVLAVIGLAAIMAAGPAAPGAAAELERTDIQGRGRNQATVLDLDADDGRVVELSMGRARLVRLPVRVRDVIVANPDVTDVLVKSPQLLYLLGKSTGSTNVVLLDNNGQQIFDLEVSVVRDVSALRRTLQTVLPEETITVIPAGDSIVLTGIVRSARVSADAYRLASGFAGTESLVINRLTIAQSQQISLHVRVAEVARNVMKELNFDGSVGGGDTGGVRQTVIDNFYGRAGLLPPVSGGRAGGFGRVFGGNPSAVFSSTSFLGGIALLLDALETEGLIRTLAEPNLTAMSGAEASFLAGGEIPVPSGVDNEGRILIQFKQFGVALKFKPVVLDDGRINLTVFTEVSQVDDTVGIVLDGIRIPGFKTRRAQTTVELPSGGALVIGGLLQNDLNTVTDGLPGLRNLPILGSLFRSENFQRRETELVITVTPYLVESMSASEVALPTDGFAIGSDLDMYLLGRIHAYYGEGGTPVPRGQPTGPFGYLME